MTTRNNICFSPVNFNNLKRYITMSAHYLINLNRGTNPRSMYFNSYVNLNYNFYKDTKYYNLKIPLYHRKILMSLSMFNNRKLTTQLQENMF